MLVQTHLVMIPNIIAWGLSSNYWTKYEIPGYIKVGLSKIPIHRSRD